MLTLAVDWWNAPPRFARRDLVLDKDCRDLWARDLSCPRGPSPTSTQNVEFSELSQGSECRRPGYLKPHLDESCVEHGLVERKVDELGLPPRALPPELDWSLTFTSNTSSNEAWVPSMRVDATASLRIRPDQQVRMRQQSAGATRADRGPLLRRRASVGSRRRSAADEGSASGSTPRSREARRSVGRR